jgi:hypothetical protein
VLLYDPARVQHFTILGFAPNTISYISVTTYVYVYLAGDQIWTLLLGKSDSTPTSWLHQQLPMTTSTSRERLTTTHRIRLRLVGFINNRRRLLDFMKNAWRHASNYFDYSFCLQASRNQLCLATRWRLLRLLVSSTKLVGINSD